VLHLLARALGGRATLKKGVRPLAGLRLRLGEPGGDRRQPDTEDGQRTADTVRDACRLTETTGEPATLQ
jgi:hypothetical protein